MSIKTKTTMHLRLPHAPQWLDQIPLPLLTAIAVLIAAAGIASIGRFRLAPPVVASPTPSLPIIIIATAQPATWPPTAVPHVQQVIYQQPAAPRYITAWAAPDGLVLGPIPAPDASAIQGRWGDDWLMIAWNGGPAWIRATDLGLSLANLAPVVVPAPEIGPRVVYVEQQGAPQAPLVEQPAYQVDTAREAQQQPAQQPTAAPQAAPAPAVQPSYPTLAPMEQNDVTQEWARVQWAAEHPEAQR